MKIRMIIEILGTPKEHVSETIGKVMEEFRKRELEILEEYIDEVKEVEQFYSTFAEIIFKTESLKQFNDICFDFMPSVVEILEPLDMKFDSKTYEDFMNDLLARLHKHGMIMRNLHAENVHLKQQMEGKNK